MLKRNLIIFYSLLMGLGMLGIWVMLLLTGQVPELASEPYRILLHIAAEMLSGMLLLAGGFALWAKKAWAVSLHRFSLGLLLYAAVQAPGYYAQLGQWGPVYMFAVLVLITIWVYFAGLDLA